MARNLETLRRAHEAFNAKNYNEAKKLVAPHGVVTDHGRNQSIASRDEFRAWMEAFHAMSSDLRIVDAQYIDGGDWVTARFRAVGSQDGPVGPLPATGKPFSIDVCEVWHFNADGEADEGHNYSDGLGLLAQLGHASQPA